nr:hypothetical protein [Cyanobacterium stanieri]
MGNDNTDIDLLIHGLTSLRKYENKNPQKQLFYGCYNFDSQFLMSPRQAYWAKKKRVSLKDSINHVSGETISVYPPGIPILMVGEKITMESLNYLKKMTINGAMITGATDNSLNTITVID